MAFHIVAFSSSIAQNGLNQVTGVTDAIVRASANGFQVPPALCNVGACWHVGATANRFQLQSQSLRQQPFPTFQPVNIGTVVAKPPRYHNLFASPLVLAPYEELDAFAYQTSAGAETEDLFVILFDSVPQKVTGPFIRARFTATGTLVARSWTGVTPTLDQALKVGTYAIVGGWAYSAGALAFRILPPSGTTWRPGGMAFQATDGIMPDFQQAGSLGIWTTFNSLTPPQIEFYSISADTAENGELFLLPM